MIKEINHGFTMDYFVPGVFTIIIGCCTLLFPMPYRLLALLIIMLGIGMLMVKTGIAIDSKNKRIRKLRTVVGLRFGSWYDVSDHDILKLDYTNETAELAGPVNNISVQTKTFDLILVSENNKTEIYEFRDYANAKKCVRHLEELLHIKVHNRFALPSNYLR